MNQKIEASFNGMVKVTIETLNGPDGPKYIACGRRNGKIVYRKYFEAFPDCLRFVNRSAGQSIRWAIARTILQTGQKAYADGYVCGAEYGWDSCIVYLGKESEKGVDIIRKVRYSKRILDEQLARS